MSDQAISLYVQNIIDGLLERITLLENENRELRKRLGLNSSNSSLPPSNDTLSKKKNSKQLSLREKSGKKAGGQEGHKGTNLAWVEKPDFIITHEQKKCSNCKHKLDESMITGQESRQVS